MRPKVRVKPLDSKNRRAPMETPLRAWITQFMVRSSSRWWHRSAPRKGAARAPVGGEARAGASPRKRQRWYGPRARYSSGVHVQNWDTRSYVLKGTFIFTRPRTGWSTHSTRDM